MKYVTSADWIWKKENGGMLVTNVSSTETNVIAIRKVYKNSKLFRDEDVRNIDHGYSLCLLLLDYFERKARQPNVTHVFWSNLKQETTMSLY